MIIIIINPLTPANTDMYLIFSEPRRLFLFEEKKCFSLQNPLIKMHMKRFNVGIFEILSEKKVRASRSRGKSKILTQIPTRSPWGDQIIHFGEKSILSSNWSFSDPRQSLYLIFGYAGNLWSDFIFVNKIVFSLHMGRGCDEFEWMLGVQNAREKDLGGLADRNLSCWYASERSIAGCASPQGCFRGAAEGLETRASKG